MVSKEVSSSRHEKVTSLNESRSRNLRFEMSNIQIKRSASHRIGAGDTPYDRFRDIGK